MATGEQLVPMWVDERAVCSADHWAVSWVGRSAAMWVVCWAGRWAVSWAAEWAAKTAGCSDVWTVALSAAKLAQRTDMLSAVSMAGHWAAHLAATKDTNSAENSELEWVSTWGAKMVALSDAHLAAKMDDHSAPASAECWADLTDSRSEPTSVEQTVCWRVTRMADSWVFGSGLERVATRAQITT